MDLVGSGNSNPIGDFFYYGSETAIGSTIYIFTTLAQGLVGGFSFGYGEIFHGDGYGYMVNVQYWQHDYKWTEGIYQTGYNSGKGSVTPEEGFRLFEGISTVASLGEITAIVRAKS